MEININILIAVLGFALSVGTFFAGRQTAAKNSGKEEKLRGRMDALEQRVKMLHGV